jgi:acyl-CoA synthetase (NDP forming)
MATLSESASKEIARTCGAVVADERVAPDPAAAAAAAAEIGYPVVLKLVGDGIAHKTERGLVRLGVRDADGVIEAARDLLGLARPDDGDVALLVAPMVRGNRELIAGYVRDPQFGPTVMLGVGGVLAEAIGDASFAPAPIDAVTAEELIDSLASQRLLGELRGEAALSRRHLVALLVGLGRLADDRPDVTSVDVNPLIVTADGVPVAVDALVELSDGPARQSSDAPAPRRYTHDQFLALFEPRGIVVTGASTHPGKFGFVALHNLLASGYEGAVHATNRSGETVLGVDTVADVDALPAGAVDLAVLCTPAAANVEILRSGAAKGIRAAFVTSAGYGEAGSEGRDAERELVAVADELGILLAGPNGQGVVSTRVSLCAQIVAPYPPAGRIAVASQSGNLVSSFLNLARVTGVGISRAVSAGNAAAVGVADYLEFYADDPASDVCLAYLESVTDGQALMTRLAGVAVRQPLVLLKGGATDGGARAAASHTGALAADHAVFDGACRAAGITRARTVEEAFDAAATFATQPRPAGPNVVVLTTAGGWGVVTADAITEHRDLHLFELPAELVAALDEHLPPRWSRNNPVDCAGGETRDTIPDVMRLIAEHPGVHAIIYIGLGIQSNQARLMRDGRFYPDHGLERIVAYHERQDERFAAAAAELSERTGKPILCATELAVADPANAGPAAVRATGRLAYPSGHRAVAALGHLVRDARHRARRA